MARSYHVYSQGWTTTCLVIILSFFIVSNAPLLIKANVPADGHNFNNDAISRTTYPSSILRGGGDNGGGGGNDLNDWIRARCGGGGDGSGNDGDDNNNIALWVYEGALYDPLDGRRIANVEGMELVQCVINVGDSSNPMNKQRYLEQCGDLEVGSILSSSNSDNNNNNNNNDDDDDGANNDITFDRISTILSRKLFCYQSPDNPKQLLQSIRLRPNAPLRPIPTRQAIAVYETATTFISRGNGKELIAHTEWPDRQSIWGMATRNRNNNNKKNPSTPSSSSSSSNTFDFTIYARQKSARKKPEQLFDLRKPPIDPTNVFSSSSNNSSAATAAVVAAPRRVKLIEFGTSSSRGKDKFGARETYSYSNIIPATSTTSSGSISSNRRQLKLQRGEGGRKRRLFGLLAPKKPTPSASPPTCQVRYSRYGEGPPFFGPGRVCSLELQGRRISSMDELPPLTASLISSSNSNAFNLTTCLQEQQQQPKSAIEWFRRSNNNNNHGLLLPELQQQQHDEFWLPDYLRDKGLAIWNQVTRKKKKQSQSV